MSSNLRQEEQQIQQMFGDKIDKIEAIFAYNKRKLDRTSLILQSGCGSGKKTLAKFLCKKYEYDIISFDDVQQVYLDEIKNTFYKKSENFKFVDEHFFRTITIITQMISDLQPEHMKKRVVFLDYQFLQVKNWMIEQANKFLVRDYNLYYKKMENIFFIIFLNSDIERFYVYRDQIKLLLKKSKFQTFYLNLRNPFCSKLIEELMIKYKAKYNKDIIRQIVAVSNKDIYRIKNQVHLYCLDQKLIEKNPEIKFTNSYYKFQTILYNKRYVKDPKKGEIMSKKMQKKYQNNLCINPCSQQIKDQFCDQKLFQVLFTNNYQFYNSLEDIEKFYEDLTLYEQMNSSYEIQDSDFNKTYLILSSMTRNNDNQRFMKSAKSLDYDLTNPFNYEKIVGEKKKNLKIDLQKEVANLLGIQEKDEEKNKYKIPDFVTIISKNNLKKSNLKKLQNVEFEKPKKKTGFQEIRPLTKDELQKIQDYMNNFKVNKFN